VRTSGPIRASHAVKRSRVPQDYIEALKWTNLAAAQVPGDTEQVFADRLARKMTAVQIAEAQKRAREWTLAFEKRKK
jgi:uncharacterized protein